MATPFHRMPLCIIYTGVTVSKQVELPPYSSRVSGLILSSGYCLGGVLYILLVSMWVSSILGSPDPPTISPAPEINHQRWLNMML